MDTSIRLLLALGMVGLALLSVGLGFIPGKALPANGVWVPWVILGGCVVYWAGAWWLSRGLGSRPMILLAFIPFVGPFLLALEGERNMVSRNGRIVGTLLLALPVPIMFLVAPILTGNIDDPVYSGMTQLVLSVSALALGINGGILYARSKAQPALLGILGLFSLMGLLILFLLPDRTKHPKPQAI